MGDSSLCLQTAHTGLCDPLKVLGDLCFLLSSFSEMNSDLFTAVKVFRGAGIDQA